MDADGNGIPDWWEIQFFGTNGINPYSMPANDGWTVLQKYQNGWNPTNFNTPPPPKNVAARLDTSGANAVITWESGGGPVTNYVVEWWGDYPIQEVDPDTLTFTTPVSQDPSDYVPVYAVRANFANGASAESQLVSVAKSSLGVDAALIRGPLGQRLLAVCSPPENLSYILLTFYHWPTFAYETIPLYATNLVNGITPVLASQVGPKRRLGFLLSGRCYERRLWAEIRCSEG